MLWFCKPAVAGSSPVASSILLGLLVASAAVAQDAPPLPKPAKDSGVREFRTPDGFVYHYCVPPGVKPDEPRDLVVLCADGAGDALEALRRFRLLPGRGGDLLIAPHRSPHVFPPAWRDKPVAYPAAFGKRLHAVLAAWRQNFPVRSVAAYGEEAAGAVLLAHAVAFPGEFDAIVCRAPRRFVPPAEPQGPRTEAVFLVSAAASMDSPLDEARAVFEQLRQAQLPLLRWCHVGDRVEWPVADASLGLAWCAAMRADDAGTLVRALEQAGGKGEGTAFDLPGTRFLGSVYMMARRLAGHPGATPRQKKLGAAVVKNIDRIAGRHVARLRKEVGRARKRKYDPGPWVGHLPAFLDAFRGVPARDELAGQVEDLLAAHRAAATPGLERFTAPADPTAEEWEEIAAILQAGCLHPRCRDHPFAGGMAHYYLREARSKLERGTYKFLERHLTAVDRGLDNYANLNRAFRLP